MVAGVMGICGEGHKVGGATLLGALDSSKGSRKGVNMVCARAERVCRQLAAAGGYMHVLLGERRGSK